QPLGQPALELGAEGPGVGEPAGVVHLPHPVQEALPAAEVGTADVQLPPERGGATQEGQFRDGLLHGAAGALRPALPRPTLHAPAPRARSRYSCSRMAICTRSW